MAARAQPSHIFFSVFMVLTPDGVYQSGRD